HDALPISELYALVRPAPEQGVGVDDLHAAARSPARDLAADRAIADEAEQLSGDRRRRSTQQIYGGVCFRAWGCHGMRVGLFERSSGSTNCWWPMTFYSIPAMRAPATAKTCGVGILDVHMFKLCLFVHRINGWAHE